MGSRRQLFVIIGAALGLTPLVAWLGRFPAADGGTPRSFAVTKTDQEWRTTLTREQYRVLREHHTEQPFSSPLDHETRRGTFICAA